MIFLLGVLAGLVAAMVLWRTVSGLAHVDFQWPWLVPLGLGLQVLMFSSAWSLVPYGETLWHGSYVMSMVAVGIFCAANWRVPGIPLLGLGLLLNGVAILANGGAMPASMQALRMAGLASTPEEVAASIASNSVVITSDTPLWFLGDIWCIPASLPFSNVFSLGDITLGLGGAWFVFMNAAPTARA
ncbi:MAG: DUF5317 domain-containing protein [Anaerolineae bacterium]